MKILAIDTTSDRVLLAAGDGVSKPRRSVSTRGPHDEKLFAEVDRLLKKTGWPLQEIDAFVGASGPGSFTGIRVGMTFVSMLAQSLGKPAVAVSLLETEAARAWPVLAQRRVDGVGAVFPAVRDELFFQIFVPDKSGLRPYSEPRWVSPEMWPKVFHQDCAGLRIALAGPAARDALRRLKPRKPAVEIWHGPPLTAADLIGPALKKLESGAGELAPLYLKPAYYERPRSATASG